MNRDDLRTVIAQSLMDQNAWSGLDITSDQASKLAGGVILDLVPVFKDLSGLACPLDHNMCPRAWTKENEA